VSTEQYRVLKAICACRTATLGGHLDVCLDCGYHRPAYNSCRNRHCPKCQALDQQRWLEARLERILPTSYFHLVFTLPAELAALGLQNRRLVYELLFRAASETLLDLGKDPDRLGAVLGITMVLHTWTRDLRFHPHVHAIVTGGGLSLDGQRWCDTGRRFLFPVTVLSRLFRGKFLHYLARARAGGDLDVPEQLDDGGAFEHLLERLYTKNWIVYAKRPFAGAEQVFAYLGRYTHRVGISNHRILDVCEHAITIATRDGKTATLTPQQLIQRFLLHVLPRRFVKIRHFGLMASANVHSKLERARSLLAPIEPEPSPTVAEHDRDDDNPSNEPIDDLIERLTGIDPRVCPVCNGRRMQRLPLQNLLRARPPPGLAAG
jgi:hypothetical protein